MERCSPAGREGWRLRGRLFKAKSEGRFRHRRRYRQPYRRRRLPASATRTRLSFSRRQEWFGRTARDYHPVLSQLQPEACSSLLRPHSMKPLPSLASAATSLVLTERIWPSNPSGPARQANVGYTSEARGYNYNPGLCYPRRMVNSNRNDMLFSSSDSQNLQRSFRGMGSMRKQGESL